MEFESISSHVNCSARFATDCLLEDYVDGTRSVEHNSSSDADPSGQRAPECDGCENKSERGENLGLMSYKERQMSF